MKKRNEPPSIFLRFFRWYCHPKLLKYIEGDLIETYNAQVDGSKFKADFNFIVDVLLLFRPGIIRPAENRNLTTSAMFKSYFKIGWRSLLTNKGYSIINVGGLAIGITVAMFIGLWIHDELSYDKYHQNYDRIGQVWTGGQNPQTGAHYGGYALQFPVGATLKNAYPQYFKHVLMAWWFGDYTVSTEDEKFARPGVFIEPGALEMLSLKMLSGNYNSLDRQNSVVISRSMAETIFGQEDPINKTLSIDNMMTAAVTGVFEDIPRNNKFGEVKFFAPWALYVSAQPWLQKSADDWDNQMTNTFVELQPNTSFTEVNEAIKSLYKKNVPADFYATIDKYKPFVQVVPMSTWHLYSEFEDGRPVGGRITFVWLFGIVGVFVLLLACINFINLSTARSEKRAKEVGVRKSIGAVKKQLVTQFLAESMMVVILAFVMSLISVALLTPMFNQLADKEISLPFGQPAFWLIAFGFIVFTGLMAGLYPAFYLSSFQPVKVLKGVLRTGRLRSLPRKILVVIQFSVSVTLIIGTIVVYKQIDHARNRPIGYYRSSLITMGLTDPAFDNKWNTLKTELLATGVVADAGTASQPLTEIWNVTGGYTWPGKDPNLEASFGNVRVGQDFGKTVGWEIVAGRDFSPDLKTDSTNSIIINEAAVKFMGIEDPVGKMFTDLDDKGNVKWSREIIGVVKDIVAGSPYQPVYQSFYLRGSGETSVLFVRIDPSVSANDALPKIQKAIEKVVPTAMFDYKFVDDAYGAKFSQEQRVGNLAAVFSVLAIFISCLGLFGLASYVAEQRTKEIGIRKVMGASITSLWQMLSKDFVTLVIIACVIAIPAGYYVMDLWLAKFEYRTEISWWVFIGTCAAAILITLITVSYQSIRAAKMSPVKSLKTE
ncbi:MAG TPA: FtsX-like permease family protein [Cyclobacteriaceae bacterium]|nr:FtsX-like permease family protein [Cyclobacteriaceae bacterium]